MPEITLRQALAEVDALIVQREANIEEKTREIEKDRDELAGLIEEQPY